MRRMKIDEVTREDGSLGEVCLRVDEDGDLLLETEGVAAVPLAFPPHVLAPIMTRYGAPFAPEAPTTEVAALDIPPDTRLRHVRHLSFHDVIAKDWLVYEREGDEPRCALAVTVAHVLSQLGQRAR